MVRVPSYVALLSCSVFLLSSGALAEDRQKTDQEARAVLKQLIEINTTDSVGNVSEAAEAMAQRLRAAGFAAQDVTVAGPNDRKKDLVVRYHGTGKKKPILFIGHLDVVEALRSDWTTNPFELIEKDDTSTAAARKT
jgi:acetylornithine deacetylase/succinyl-diaminopimelate desuccinylase-like protein